MIASIRACCSNNVVRVSRLTFGEQGSSFCNPRPSTACFHIFSSPRKLYLELNASSSPASPRCCSSHGFSKQRRILRSVTANYSGGPGRPHRRHFTVSFGSTSTKLKLLIPGQGDSAKVKYNAGSPRLTCGRASGGLFVELLVCCSTSGPVRAEGANDKGNGGNVDESSDAKFAHGKRVCTDYSFTGIPGDGRCLFRSVIHGASRRMGKPAPNESLQRELADELRARVADEFLNRREETEWFVEGDFDTYVSQMRKPHVWGGEPELFMASHVLKMPITVYMYDKDAGGLISIAEYGEEYGKDNPIRVLYHGFGHYDALQIPGLKGSKSKL